VSSKKSKLYKQKKPIEKSAPPQKTKTAKAVSVAEKTPKKIGGKVLLPGSWKLNAVTFLSLVVATVILYSTDLHLDFFRVDDKQYVVNNPWIKGITAENISHILTNPYFVNYSPVHLYSYMLDYAVNRLDPYIFHLSSNIWAGIVAGFVFLTGLALTRRYFIAAAAAVLFVVHPVHVEAIAWIASRKDLVATAFALPSLITYLKYRNQDTSRKWYIISLILFLFAIAGKLSVATLPVIFLAFDLFVEKRVFRRSLVDKIPYIAIAAIMAMIVAGAQPATGSRPDPYILLSALVQNFWLITGFGKYVIYRVAPVPQGTMIEIAAAIGLVIIFLAPLLLRRRFPLMVTLVYWILFAFIPTQVLSFAYPVTDRYLFFPSVAMSILIANATITASEKFFKKAFIPAAGVLVIIAAIWCINTIHYLQEWNDPRSVWYAASKKSQDPLVYYNLGWDYMDNAARFGTGARKAPLSKEEAARLASRVWEHDPRLPSLLDEWDKGAHGGLVEKQFVTSLRGLAHNAYNEALARKGKHVMADFYFHRGMLFLDEGKIKDAEREFMNGINEASRSSFTEGNQEVLVNCHYNLGVAYWTEGNYTEALKWMTMVEEEQARFRGNWFPDVSTYRQRLEQMIKARRSQ
jgi:protein O-mannosyl-transferase